jgi:hypothetical protein
MTEIFLIRLKNISINSGNKKNNNKKKTTTTIMKKAVGTSTKEGAS